MLSGWKQIGVAGGLGAAAASIHALVGNVCELNSDISIHRAVKATWNVTYEPPPPKEEGGGFWRIFDPPQRQQQQGSGFLIRPGLIASSHHIVAGTHQDRCGGKVTLNTMDGSAANGTILHISKEQDCMFIGIDDAPEKEPAAAAAAVEPLILRKKLDALSHSRDILHVRNITGDEHPRINFFFDRLIGTNLAPEGRRKPLLVTSISTIPGYSGGPVVDSHGFVIGMCCSGSADRSCSLSVMAETIRDEYASAGDGKLVGRFGPLPDDVHISRYVSNANWYIRALMK